MPLAIGVVFVILKARLTILVLRRPYLNEDKTALLIERAVLSYMLLTNFVLELL